MQKSLSKSLLSQSPSKSFMLLLRDIPVTHRLATESHGKTFLSLWASGKFFHKEILSSARLFNEKMFPSPVSSRLA